MTQSISTTALNYSTDSLSGEEPGVLGLPSSAWKKAAVVAVVFVALFWTNLWRLWLKTNPFFGEANWGHAVCIPVIGLYYLYIHRDELLRAGVVSNLPGIPSKARLITAMAVIFAGLSLSIVGPHVSHSTFGDASLVGGRFLAVWGVLILLLNYGLGTAIFGILFFAYGIYPGQNDYIKDLGMVITLFGVVLTMCGWEVMKIAWFPIVFLVCALPWPGLVYSWVASPLQYLAASVAVGVLRICQIDAFHTGTKIVMGQRTLNVAEACAGLRSLMTFISVAAAVAFLSARPIWQKCFITAMAVPIAVLCNVMRVSGQGIIDYNLGAEWSENFAHQFVGLLMLVPAFFLILLVGWVLDKIFIEEADETEMAGAAEVETIIRASKPKAKPLTVALPRPAAAAKTINAPTPPSPANSTSANPAPAANSSSPVGVPIPPRKIVTPPNTVAIPSRTPRRIVPPTMPTQNSSQPGNPAQPPSNPNPEAT